jgi:hypothetical protein
LKRRGLALHLPASGRQWTEERIELPLFANRRRLAMTWINNRIGRQGQQLITNRSHQRSVVATRQIKGLVEAIQKSANSTVMVTEEGLKAVDRAAILVENVHQSFGSLGQIPLRVTAQPRAVVEDAEQGVHGPLCRYVRERCGNMTAYPDVLVTILQEVGERIEHFFAEADEHGPRGRLELAVAEQQVQRYEATQYKGVSVERLQAVADALKLRVREVITFEPL